MRISKLVLLPGLILLQVFVLLQPVHSAAPVRSQAVPVRTILTHYGTLQGSIDSLADLDQSGMDDEPGKYMLFSGTDTAYYGEMDFLLPNEVRVGQISSALLQVNFNGPPFDEQTWSWLIRDQVTGYWHPLGDSIGIPSGKWNILLFPVSSMRRYVSSAGEVHIRFRSDRKGNHAKIDYEALHITYMQVTLTPTRPTETPYRTKAAYSFPATFTPTITFTPTDTPTATHTPTRTPSRTPTPTPICEAFDDSFECQVLYLINQERAKLSLPPLISNVQLHSAAEGHSTDMAQNDFFSHTGSNGSTFSQRITNAGYTWTACAENIAAGATTPASVMELWMASDGHKANILNPNYVHIGIGYVYDANDPLGYHHYWTTDFGKP